MRVPNAAELLDVWERGLPLSATSRALALVEAGCPGGSSRDLAALPIGERDARLVELRDLLLGPELTVVASCPACGEQLESTFHSADIRTGLGPSEPVHAVEASGYRIVFRLVSSTDMLALSSTTDPAFAR